MLDKQLPYAEIWMTRPLNEELPSYHLNQQYHFEKYQPGAEQDWAIIETAVGEFVSVEEALAYFDQALPLIQKNWQSACILWSTNKVNALPHALLGGSFVKKEYPLFIG